MKIYRVENLEGDGAYRAGSSSSWSWPTNARRHPLPEDDSALDWWDIPRAEREEFFFGFDSEGQFRSWFYSDEWLGILSEHGLQLTVWEVENPDDYRIGNAQAVFRKERAKLLERRPLV